MSARTFLEVDDELAAEQLNELLEFVEETGTEHATEWEAKFISDVSGRNPDWNLTPRQVEKIGQIHSRLADKGVL